MHRKIIQRSNIFQSKLSRKIIFWIFVSLMIIETIILIPSVRKREKDLVLQDRDVIYGKISWILMAYPDLSESEFLDHIKKLKTTSNLNSILGATIYNENGVLIEKFGKEKKISWKEIKESKKLFQINPDDTYDLIFFNGQIPHNCTVVITHDGSLVKKELWDYKVRIFWLIVIISIFITVAMMIALNKIIITPILKLREDLIAAPEALKNGNKLDICPSNYTKRNDELGEVLKAFQEMFNRVYEADSILKREREKSDKLLLNILPPTIAEKLKHNQNSIAQGFTEVSILFADIVGFTELSENISPKELVELLNKIFSTFDQLCDEYHLEKIKTIGDAYMVASGLPTPREDHAIAIADMALKMQEKIREFNQIEETDLSIRIGINTGSAIAGVIGVKKFIYDLWGDAVNTASRMESHGIPGKIQVTQTTYNKLKEHYIFEHRGLIEIKGKGLMETYLLQQKKKN